MILMGFEPQTFRPTVRRANHCAMGAGDHALIKFEQLYPNVNKHCLNQQNNSHSFVCMVNWLLRTNYLSVCHFSCCTVFLHVIRTDMLLITIMDISVVQDP